MRKVGVEDCGRNLEVVADCIAEQFFEVGGRVFLPRIGRERECLDQIAAQIDRSRALFGAHFREEYPQESQPVTRAEGDAAARYTANLLPLEYRPRGTISPVLSYPYDRTREALEQLARGGDPHPVHGYKLRYANPATGGHAFPTMAAFMQWLPKGHAGRRARSTDGAIYCVVEGRGSAAVGETRFDFSPHDVFVVPSWEYCQFAADTACVLFSYSDRAAQEALGFWREECGTS